MSTHKAITITSISNRLHIEWSTNALNKQTEAILLDMIWQIAIVLGLAFQADSGLQGLG